MSLQIERERGTRRQTHWTLTLVLDFSGYTDTPPPSMTRMSVYSQQRAVWLSTKCAISLGKLTSDHSRFVPEHIFTRKMSYLYQPFRSFSRCHYTQLRSYASGSSVLLWFQKGDKAAVSKKFSPEDVRLFAELSGDTNPLHTDEEYAAKTRFGKTVVHGILLNG